MNVIAKISYYFQRSVIAVKLRKEYLNTVIYNTLVLLRIKKLNSLVYSVSQKNTPNIFSCRLT